MRNKKSRLGRNHLRLTPDRAVLLLVGAEAMLLVWNWVRWPAWHKGYAVLTCLALVGVSITLIVAWLAASVALRRQFQFSVRSMLFLVVVVAVPLSWLGVETKKAREHAAS